VTWMVGWTKQRFSHHKVTWWARHNKDFLITKWHGGLDKRKIFTSQSDMDDGTIHVTLWWENLCFV
jgi:hypothetical protein